MGPTSMAVTRRLASSCSGWPQRPTGPEFYDAVHAQRPTFRQRCLIVNWRMASCSPGNDSLSDSL